MRVRHSSRKGSSFPAEMPLIKLIGAASDSSNISALVPQEHQIRMSSDERDQSVLSPSYPK